MGESGSLSASDVALLSGNNGFGNCNCTSWDVCKKLAILYIIREHYNNSPIQKDTGLNMSMSSPISIK